MGTKAEEPNLHELASRLAELEQANARLHEELTSLRVERAAVEEQAGRQRLPSTRKSSRRRMLTRGLEVAAATVGVGTLLELSSGPAAASTKAGDFASSTAGTPAVRATGTNGANGVEASSDSGTGLLAKSSSGLAGHFVGNVSMNNNLTVTGALNSGIATFATSTAGTSAVRATGSGTNGIGVIGNGAGAGVFGESPGTGVFGFSSGGAGVFGESTGSGPGVQGRSGGTGLAGLFEGDVQVTGTLSKGGGSFKIDHPLDPAHKYLSHSFVESPDMKNIYDGVVTLDDNGEAEVGLPAWFDALNTEFRYQLTALDRSAPDLYISQEIRGNRFKIAGGQAGMRVSWQVSGIRQDAWANAYRIPVEQDKPAEEQDSYLHPELYGQSEQQGGMREHHPDLPLPSMPR